MIETNQNSYRMELVNSQSWEMVAGCSAISWLDEIARIMELDRGSKPGSSKMIFVKKDLESVEGSIAREECEEQEIGLVHIRSNKDRSFSVCELEERNFKSVDFIRMMQFLYYIYSQVQRSGGIPMHAALIERDGYGVVIAAPSGTGKSTCSRRVPSPWHALSDDELLVVRDKEGRYYAHPFPTWSEYIYHMSNRTWNVQRSVPLKAIFILERSQIDEVRAIGQAEAATYIYHSASQVYQRGWVYLNPEQKNHAKRDTFEIACLMARTIPAFTLRASLTGRFWEHMDKALENHEVTPASGDS